MGLKKYIACMAIFIFLLIMVTETYAQEQEEPVTISADYLEYVKTKNIVIGRGHVQIIHLGTKITGQEATADLNTNDIHIQGNVVVTDKTGEIKGDNIVYNIKTKKGRLGNSTSYSNPWYIRGKEVQSVSDKQAIIRQGYFTTCELAEPHYRFQASKISVYLQDKIIAYNVFLYIGRVPIFYFPVFWQNLKGTKYDLDVKVGYSDVEGTFAKVRFGYPLTANLYGRIYLDYMSMKGLGKGGEFIYKSDNIRSSLYGYHIREIDTEQERRSGKFSHWQKIGKDLTVMSDMNFVSDEKFNTQYKEQDPTRITQDFKSYLALTLTQPLYIARIVGERRDIWSTDRFIRDYLYMPRFSFDTISLRLNKNKLFPLYYKANLGIDNYYAQPPNDFYRLTANADQRLTTSLRLGRFLTVSPSVGFLEQWQNRTSKTDDASFNHHIYKTNLNLRNNISSYFYVNYGHSFQEEMGQAPSLNQLSGEVNLLFPRTIQTIDTQNRTVSRRTNFIKLNTSTTYDMRRVGGTFADWKQRLSNLLTRLYFTPADWNSLNVDHYYNLYSEKTERLQTTVRVTKSKWEVTLGTTYFSSQPRALDTSTSLYFWLTDKWKISFTNRADVYYKANEYKYSHWSERTYTIWRDMHCWEAQFYWTKRPTEEELWFKFNIKAFPKQKIGLDHKVEEGDWHLTSGQ
ncbi:MAG: hypothetical protein V1653_00635 [bacterium]